MPSRLIDIYKNDFGINLFLNTIIEFIRTKLVEFGKVMPKIR